MDDSNETTINSSLASLANEEMKAKYSYNEIEEILTQNGLLIYEHLDYSEIIKNYFHEYNEINKHNKIIAPKGVCYCLAVKNILKK